MFVTVILMLRLHAMYGQSKRIVSLIVPTFLVVLALELVILVVSSLAQEGWLITISSVDPFRPPDPLPHRSSENTRNPSDVPVCTPKYLAAIIPVLVTFPRVRDDAIRSGTGERR